MKIKILKYIISFLLLVLFLINIFLIFLLISSKIEIFLKIVIIINFLLYLIFVITYSILIKIENKLLINQIERQKKINEKLFNEKQLLNKKINILTKEHLYYETNNAAFVNILKSIKNETKKIRKNLFNNLRKPEDMIHSLNTINTYIDNGVKTLNLKIYFQENVKDIINYDIYLIKKEKLLFLIKDNKVFKFELSNTLFLLLELFIKKLVDDIKDKISLEERGFIERKIIEKEIFQGIEDSNRFNSNKSRIRKMLKNSGLNPNFIENKNNYYRLNTISDKIFLLEDIKEFNIVK